MVKEGETIVVWFSCGAASAVAAKKTVEQYGKIAKIRVVNNFIQEEHPDNRRFLRDVQEWLGIPIEIAQNPKYPGGSCDEVWRYRKYMSGPAGAPCTEELKKRARLAWEKDNLFDWIVLGFTSDEEKRSARFIRNERDNLLPVLIQHGISKSQCYNIIREAGIELPEVYKLGYPNANCIGCVKASSPTYWNHVRQKNPEVFNDRAVLSREIGARLAIFKGKRIFLDELPTDAKGYAMRTKDFECGIFCEERQ